MSTGSIAIPAKININSLNTPRLGSHPYTSRSIKKIKSRIAYLLLGNRRAIAMNIISINILKSTCTDSGGKIKRLIIAINAAAKEKVPIVV